MTLNELYDPFKTIDLVGNKCFLTGNTVSKEIDYIYVFPEWLMSSENLFEKPFKMLDENYKTYADLKLPLSSHVREKIDTLNKKIENFFVNHSDETITEIEWFQWCGVIVYGLIYNEIRNGIKSEEFKEEGFRISPLLIKKFKNLHLQLQSLIHEVEWDEPLPFSLLIISLDDAIETSQQLEHKNEINTLTFSFKYKSRALIICLQDVGTNINYHESLLSKIESKVLHPIQFAELAAKFYYSNYLLSIICEFDYTIHNNILYITNIENTYTKVFDKWDEKTFSQVLEAFWKEWKYSKIEIFKNAEKCMSFLLDQNQKFIEKVIV